MDHEIKTQSIEESEISLENPYFVMQAAGITRSTMVTGKQINIG